MDENKAEIAKEILAFIIGASMSGARAGSGLAGQLLASASGGGYSSDTGMGGGVSSNAGFGGSSSNAGIGGGRSGGGIARSLLSAASGGGTISIPGISGGGMPSIPGMSAVAQKFLAKQYPSEFAPKAWHIYDVVHIPGKPNFNQHGKANAGVIEDAGVMQDIDLHNRTITKYIRPGMNPKEERLALQQGLLEEKALPQFWNESDSRRQFTVSSSAVTGIRLTPDARIEVQWRGKPKWYTFREYPNTYEASKAAQDLLKADSIGQAVMPYQRKGVKLNFKDPKLCWWNKNNYDPAYA